MANAVTFELRATDIATPVVNRATGNVVTQTKAVEQAALTTNRHTAAMNTNTAASAAAERQQRRLNTAIEKVTTSTGLAATTVTRLSGIVQGLATGVVIGAVIALSDKVIEQTIKWLDLETAASRAQKTIASFGRTMAQSVAPALLPIQTRLEEIDKQLNNINARTPQAAAAIRSRLEAEKENLTRLRDTIVGPQPREQTAAELFQEAEGRNILARRQAQMREAEQLALARSTFEIERAKIQSDADAFAEHGRQQEALGYQIQLAAHQDYLNSLKTARSQFEIDYTTIVAAGEQHRKEFAAEMRAIEFTGQMNILDMLVAAIPARNKKLFLLQQMTSVGVALVKAHEAAAIALAQPSLTPAEQIAKSSLILKYGYANAFAAAAIRLGSAALSGGGGGGGGGGSPGVSSIPSGGRDITTGAGGEQRIVVELHFANAELANALYDPIVKIMGERGGRGGGYQVEVKR